VTSRTPQEKEREGTVTISVVQWTTGNVGKESVKAIVTNPGLELVGCFAWSDSKVGVDVGELVGIDPIGVAATNDVDALFALRPDVVVYNPMWPSLDEMVRILDAGIDIVTTAAFITGDRSPAAGGGALALSIHTDCNRSGS